MASLKRHQSFIGLVVVLAVTAIAVALTMQGWRSRIPAFDLVPHIHNTRNLLATGTIPVHGDTGSYGSYKPPGTAWLMLPSALLFADPRLSEYVGTALLHFASLLGVLLLARAYFGVRCAYLAVPLYGLSEHGLILAGSLWPNGRPDFYVWIVYLASRWVKHKDARYLAAALSVWATGMFVDMAIAPALFVLPALWLYSRPPVRLRPLLLGGVLALVVWSPYLALETGRGFADMRSQFLLQPIHSANYKDTWCDPNSTLVKWEEGTGKADPAPVKLDVRQAGPLDPLSGLLARGSRLTEKILSNFEQAVHRRGMDIVLALIVFAGLISTSMSGSSGETASTETSGSLVRHRLWRKWRTPVAIFSLLLALLAIEFVVPRFLGKDETGGMITVSRLRKIWGLLTLVGLAVLEGKRLTAAVGHLMARMRLIIQTEQEATGARQLALGLIVPWLILVLAAEPGKPERFWWIWPLQTIFLAAFVTYVLPRLGVHRWVVGICQVLLILVIVGNSFLTSRTNSWLRSGWSGRDAQQIQVVDYVAGEIRAGGTDSAAIGYHTFIYPFMAEYNITNPQYKVGSELDLLFKYRTGVSNTNLCAEGISPEDQYRIVQVRPQAEEWAPREYFDARLGGSYYLVREFGSYQVFKRDQKTAPPSDTGGQAWLSAAGGDKAKSEVTQ